MSFAKLLVLAAVLAAVWFGFRYLQARTRDTELPRGGTRDGAKRPVGAPPGPSRAETPPGVTEDLLKCPVCATYVTRGASRCGRADCPY
ncbi:MAG: hypothetical protein HY060_04570 [Proteobacteria bacterium]|nr:hypothetical protein [Pseudomonadota bacterium]